MRIYFIDKFQPGIRFELKEPQSLLKSVAPTQEQKQDPLSVQQVQQRVAVGTRERPYFISGCQVVSAAGRSVSRPSAAAADATRYGRRRY